MHFFGVSLLMLFGKLDSCICVTIIFYVLKRYSFPFKKVMKFMVKKLYEIDNSLRKKEKIMNHSLGRLLVSPTNISLG